MTATRLLARIALIAGLAASFGAGAHDELQSADWCTTGTVAYTGEFVVTHEQLVTEMNRREAARQRCQIAAARPTDGSGTNGGDLTCGISDPPYELARSMAGASCGGTQPSGTGGDIGTTVAFIIEPSSFNAADHHQVFSLETGLHGICGICLLPLNSTPAPAPPRNNN